MGRTNNVKLELLKTAGYSGFVTRARWELGENDRIRIMILTEKLVFITKECTVGVSHKSFSNMT